MKIIIVTLCLIGVTFGLPGGFSSLPVDDPTVVRLTSKAVEYHNQISNSIHYKKLVNVQSARYQVVAGTNYQITLVIGSTECPKTDSNAINCNISANKIPEECTYTIWVKLDDDVQVTNAVCKLTQAPTRN